ncbi:unnamed protein product, partial [Candidula unifasciata]
MANIYKGQDRPESDFDPFQNVKASNFDSDPNQNRSRSQSFLTPKKSLHPFSRDFIDSVCTVVNKDLLYCKLFYLFFFGAFGSLFPLLAIYFKQLGMNASQTGLLIGFRPFIEFLSAPFWGSLADRWRRGKEMLLFSILCWIVFTVAIAFVQPPAHKCLTFNGTHNILEVPIGRRRRDNPMHATPVYHFSDNGMLTSDGVPNLNPEINIHNNDHRALLKDFASDSYNLYNHHQSSKDANLPSHLELGRSIVLPADLTSFYIHNRYKRGYQEIDPSKIANVNVSDVKGLLFNQHSAVVYQEGQVKHAFFILLLLVIIGEFFSAPAVTFADSVTLSFLGEDVQNYGRQRMFGSIGWGLAMFFVGMALDHSTTFPDHPCGKAHIREKNYTVCFAVFCVLMSCAFLAALQFRFDHHSQDLKLSEVPGKVKNKVKKIISGHRKIDRERLVEEYSDDEELPTKKYEEELGNNAETEKKQEDINLKINPVVGSDMVTDALKAPGAKVYPGRGFGGVTGAIPFGSAEASYSDQPFFGKWIAVMKLLAAYEYISVLIIAWFMGFGIGIIFTFLFWHLQDLNGSPTLFGVASVINHISELFAYFLTGSFISKYGHVKVLYAGLAGNVARFMYISLLTNPWWVLPFEFVQGLTHAAVWAACCAYITHAIPVELRSSAQSIIQGLHHGLGRGCGAVFGGLMVYKYGSVVTFRIYGVFCIIVLAAYMAVNVLLQRKGRFSHGSHVPHELFEDTAHLAPHGVPSGAAIDLTGKRLTGEPQQGENIWLHPGSSG